MTKHFSDAIQSRCSWPNLNEPFATALRDAVDFICQSFEPVGILATGTIVRGCAHRSSDLDLHVVHLAPHRRRVQRFFNGVPAEIFVNPPSAVRAYFVDEDREGRRITAHMLTTSIVVFQADAVVDELRKEAAQWLVKETRQSDSESTGTRYSIASQLEDALDLIGIDDVTAAMLMSQSVFAMLEYLCKAEHGQIPRGKDLLARVAAYNVDVATRTAEFFQTSDVAARSRLATEIADRTIGVRGFFEWDSGPGPAPKAVE